MFNNIKYFNILYCIDNDEIKSIFEYKEGIKNLNNRNYSSACTNFKDCANILVSAKANDTEGYLIVLNK